MKNKISMPGWIQAIAVFYLVIWTVSPPLSIDLIYRLVALVAAGGWAVFAFGRGLRLTFKHIWAFVFILLVVLITYLRTNSFSGLIKQISWYILFICFIIFAFYYKNDSWFELKWIIPFFLLLLIVFNIRSFTVLIEDPTIARRIVRADESIYVYLRQGVGGYAFVYSQVMISPAIEMWTVKEYKHNKIKFLFGLIWFVTYIILVLNASYSLAMFTTFASLLVLFFYKGKSGIGVIIVTLGLFIGAMASIMYIEPFRNWLLVQFDGTAVAKKINDLVTPNDSGGEDSIQVRVAQYLGSLKAITEYPIIGSLGRPSSSGTHSNILDTFAAYGLFGGLMNFYMVFETPLSYKKRFQYNKTIISVCNAVLVSILLVTLLDTLTYEMMPCILIMLPIFIDDIIVRTNINENSLDM